jgi:spore coat polysaccharide biosynthesis protein SpsF
MEFFSPSPDVDKATASENGLTMAFLQARMGSSRLPGKVMMRIHGQTILERAIRRLKSSPAVQRVAVLTTILPADDVIVREAEQMGAWIHRGSVQDVLARFQEASEKFGPDIIIRATADNPLIDIGSIDRIIDALRAGDLDWCMEKDLPYGAATEAISAKALERVSRCAHSDQDREHVTLYIKEHPNEFRIGLLEPPSSVRRPDVRITVDTLEDFQYVERLIGMASERFNPIPLAEYLPLAPTI